MAVVSGSLGALRALGGHLPGTGRARDAVGRRLGETGVAELLAEERMLADEVRVSAYDEAIRAYVEPGETVLDLGGGVGLTACLAARRGATVHAVGRGPLLDAAVDVAADNGIDTIRFHRADSRRLELDEQADVLVHGLLGDALLDRDVVALVADARDRLLRPGGRILPGVLELFIEPVELAPGTRAPFAWQQQVRGISFRAMAGHGRRRPASYRLDTRRPFPLGRMLCEPEPVLRIDLATAGPRSLPRTIDYARPAVEDGVLDGFCVYFRAAFDDELSLSTAPDEPTTSWSTPLMRVASRPVRTGELVRLSLRARDLADPTSWEWI